MELGFRRHGGLTRAHPSIGPYLLEVPPGSGGTLMFEVKDMTATRAALQAAGGQLRGDVLHCSGGLELISIFEDPFGRPLQLYQPNFPTADIAVAMAARVSSTVALSDATVQVGSNLRDVRGLGFGIAFEVENVELADRFYGDVLNLRRTATKGDEVSFELDGTPIRFRRAGSGVRSIGGAIGFEVTDPERSSRHPILRQMIGAMTYDTLSQLKGEAGQVRDPDGNLFEFWAARGGNA
jgi:catechol 2,3-dioxygenase-like lactoylglutathione lyase family enzyme